MSTNEYILWASQQKARSKLHGRVLIQIASLANQYGYYAGGIRLLAMRCGLSTKDTETVVRHLELDSFIRTVGHSCQLLKSPQV